jgi:hypothetical protein
MMKNLRRLSLLVALLFCAFCCITTSSFAQDSTPKIWVKQLLFSITNDFARPPIHARNLHHLSIVMHDAWAALEPGTDTYFLGKELHGFQSDFLGFPQPNNPTEKIAFQEEAISFAAYRLIRHRFLNAPGAFFIYQSIDSVMNELGYDKDFTSTNYLLDGPAALGNYIAEQMIQYGLQDGSNESANYVYQYYEPVNPPVEVELPGNPTMLDPNRWQPITLSNPVDQAGNPLPNTPLHLGPEWGNVNPFGLSPSDITVYQRDGYDYNVYLDPGPPPLIDTNIATGMEDFYKWNFVLVSIWQSHLDPDDNTMWDISPASIGNISSYPSDWSDYETFYDLYNGGESSPGHPMNPITGLPYAPQIVKRADYARVLAEFWADGLDSETPPGHWFKIYNEVSEHQLFERKWKGEGDELSPMEYDAKAYLTLGGAMHDAAIVAWSIKGWYDYPRPASVLRYMAEKGQSSDPMLPNFHPAGLPLIPGYVELVELGDPLVGGMNEHLNKIKLYTWRGHGHVYDPETEAAGVGWILAENWWPYQRPSFVNPPFAGYISGHSTYSSAAAEVMSFITGSPYFPGGMSNFVALQDEFLEFELGPSETIVLQWATYKDAADQCSLSRIWGGIHPPVDDIPGRQLGMQSGNQSSLFADAIFENKRPAVVNIEANYTVINSALLGETLSLQFEFDSIMNTAILPTFSFPVADPLTSGLIVTNQTWLNNQTLEISFEVIGANVDFGYVHVALTGAESTFGNEQDFFVRDSVFVFDTKAPEVILTNLNFSIVNNQHNNQQLVADIYFSEPCQPAVPSLLISPVSPIDYDFSLSGSSTWINPNHFQAIWDINLFEPAYQILSIALDDIVDMVGNAILTQPNLTTFTLDSEPPYITTVTSNQSVFNENDVGPNKLQFQVTFSRNMDISTIPEVDLISNGNPATALILNSSGSSWVSLNELTLSFDILANEESIELETYLLEVMDEIGNKAFSLEIPEVINIDTKKPEVISVTPSHSLIEISNFINQDFYVDIQFNEQMNVSFKPLVTAFQSGIQFNPMTYNPFVSYWFSNETYRAYFTLPTLQMNENDIYFFIQLGRDSFNNLQTPIASGSTVDINYDPAQVGLGEESNLNLRIYPNPIVQGDKITIRSDKKMSATDIRIVNNLGQEQSVSIIVSDAILIDSSQLSAGSYNLIINLNDSVKTFKIIVL